MNMVKNNIVLYAAVVGGALLALVGVLGLVIPTVMGFHLNVAIHLTHLLSGALAVYFGLKSSTLALQTFCRAIGVLYALVGAAGLVDAFAIGSGGFTSQIVQHLFHLVVGVGFVVAAIMQPVRTVGFSPP